LISHTFRADVLTGIASILLCGPVVEKSGAAAERHDKLPMEMFRQSGLIK